MNLTKASEVAMTGVRRDVRDLLLADLEQEIAAAGEPRFRARQIMDWLYAKRRESFDDMRNIPGQVREYLKHNFKVSRLAPSVSRSSDGTRKLKLALDDAEVIETVIIPAGDRVTLCLSSQAGCAMGCRFCATALMGLHRNLSAGEIVGQIIEAEKHLEPGERLTNYVFMGMGEPLANYPRLVKALAIMSAPWGLGIAPRRITVSTVGLAPMIERLIAETRVRLAISLHAASNELRGRLAPINRRYPLEVLLETCRRLPIKRRDRITFEYVMLAGVNDSTAEAQQLVELLGPLRAKVNLILFNPFEGAPFQASSRQTVSHFQAVLQRGNLTATVRESRGQDIAAACGQLCVTSKGAAPLARRADAVGLNAGGVDG